MFSTAFAVEAQTERVDRTSTLNIWMRHIHMIALVKYFNCFIFLVPAWPSHWCCNKKPELARKFCCIPYQCAQQDMKLSLALFMLYAVLFLLFPSISEMDTFQLVVSFNRAITRNVCVPFESVYNPPVAISQSSKASKSRVYQSKAGFPRNCARNGAE